MKAIFDVEVLTHQEGICYAGCPYFTETDLFGKICKLSGEQTEGKQTMHCKSAIARFERWRDGYDARYRSEQEMWRLTGAKLREANEKIEKLKEEVKNLAERNIETVREIERRGLCG